LLRQTRLPVDGNIDTAAEDGTQTMKSAVSLVDRN